MRAHVHQPLTMAGAVMVVICSVTPAAAQSTAPRQQPFRGLFGPPATEPALTRKLDFDVALAQSYDDNTLASLDATADPTQPGRYHYTFVQGSGAYLSRTRQTDISADFASSLRYYGGFNQLSPDNQLASVSLNRRISRRNTLLFGQTLAYSPATLYGLYGDIGTSALPTVAAADYANQSESYAYGSSAGVARTFGRSSRLSGTTEFEYRDYLHETPTRRDVTSYGGQAQYYQDLSRSVTMSGRYRYRTVDYGVTGAPGAGVSTQQEIDFGLSYTRDVSPSRQALFSFRLGSSVVDIPVTAADQTTFSGQSIGLHGEIGAGYQFRRGWEARGTYRRSLEYVAEFPEPVFAGSGGIAIEGWVTPRLDIRVTADSTKGASALTGGGIEFDSYAGNVRVRYAFTRKFAAYSEFWYYLYQFRGATPVPGVPEHLERSGVRGGVMVWLPTFRR